MNPLSSDWFGGQINARDTPRKYSARTQSVFHLLDNAELRVVSTDGKFDWHGRIDGLPVIEVQSAPHGSFAIALLDPQTRSGRVRNLVKISSDASVSWRAELPLEQGTDSYVSFELESAQNLRATTWSCYRVRLSVESGEVIDHVFTK
jgi:hypothetical protein